MNTIIEEEHTETREPLMTAAELAASRKKILSKIKRQPG
jgi:hypothetical protein